MDQQTEFFPLGVDALSALAADRKREGWRFVQMLAVNTENGCDLVYSFMKDGRLENYVVQRVTADVEVPSITDQFLAAFVFENEAHDLFGVNIKNIAIDFGGKFYQLAQTAPMTIISPEQKAAREKAAKIAAAKAAKAEKEGAAKEDAQDAAAAEAALEAKLAGMDPEKAAKVRAAMEAKAKKEAAVRQAAVEAKAAEKIANLDPEKAAKVKAALEAKAKREAAAKQAAAVPAAEKEGE